MLNQNKVSYCSSTLSLWFELISKYPVMLYVTVYQFCYVMLWIPYTHLAHPLYPNGSGIHYYYLLKHPKLKCLVLYQQTFESSKPEEILESTTDAADWKLEVERVMPQLKVTIRTDNKVLTYLHCDDSWSLIWCLVSALMVVLGHCSDADWWSLIFGVV